ncbi:siderophore-interacting protein [Nesterenkonia sandarakina]|uniref:NADPH-dependent ferric siderophore reductase n=1 Tax=Nesterenkonia sandarakina TaxID=272918 RepID=A0A7Z0J3G2_9MICC|nr:siderophore-interacting protein [Nesterenkonia sandarakina]NYJ16733.1 NADPH-dependent ferric siderophore reductase [Nesterenkonia sandarakina]
MSLRSSLAAVADRAVGDGDAVDPATLNPQRAYATVVARVQRLSPNYLRFTLEAEELRHFHTGGLDQRIKLLLPRADGTLPDLGLFDQPQPEMMQWYTTWRQLPEAERNPIRTYTVRAIRPWAQQIDVDFVVHGTEGPASAWAMRAEVGDELVVIGPDGRSTRAGGGIEFDPHTARDVLLAGDETAVPAICAILEMLPERVHGEAYLEIPTRADALDVANSSGVEIFWLPREGAARGAPLTSAVQNWGRRRAEIFAQRRASWQPARGEPVGAPSGAEDLAELGEDDLLWEVGDADGFREYAWLAGEAGVITGLRRHLVKDVGLSRKQVSFMGYWKQGRAS